jgi:protein TonB
MEQKKTNKANLERTRALRFVLALVAVVSLFVVTLNLSFIPAEGGFDEAMLDDIIEEMDLSQEQEQDEMIAVETPKPEEKPATELKVVDEVLTDEQTADLLEDADTEGDPEDTQLKEKLEPIEQEPKDLDDEPLNFRIVSQLPEFPGGLSEYVKWLTKNLKYPEEARRQHLQGKVMVSFVINRDGSLTDIKVEKGVHPLLDNEALRVMKTMPKWKPGIQDDKPCRTLFAVPIIFKL